MKAAGLQQMAAMETLMRENFFTASISALVPGVGLMLAAGGGQRSLLEGPSWRCHATPAGRGRLACRLLGPGLLDALSRRTPPPTASPQRAMLA